MRIRYCLTLAALALAALAPAARAQDGAADLVEQGRRIYEEGILSDGSQMHGIRAGVGEVVDKEANCITCHRRSGMGGVEGDIQVSPITARFLFSPPDEMARATMDPRTGKRMNLAHAVYDDHAIAMSIRSGVNSSGRQMNPMMPTYPLEDRDMLALTAYMHQLSSTWSPGVTDDSVRFAAVITPGIDPERKQALLDMLRGAMLQKNGSTVTSASRRRHMVSAAEFVLGTERKWAIDIWELKGEPATWRSQLDGYERLAPPFALITGLGTGTWQPVQEFCESRRIPCWFPSVDLVPAGPEPRYSLYYTRGVAFEAEVLARHLLAEPAPPKRVLQVFVDDEVGRGAVGALQAALVGSTIRVEPFAFEPGQERALKKALKAARPDTTVMFWLRRPELEQLAKISPPRATSYFSGRLAGAELTAIPAKWKVVAHVVYPYALPEQRALSLQYFKYWLTTRKITLVDEAMQSEVYFGLNFLTDTMAEMLDNVYRDYLIERAETMIGQRETKKVEDEIRDIGLVRPRPRAVPMGARKNVQFAPGYAEHAAGLREGTTVFPRLALGPGQRYASRQGYIVSFAAPDASKLVIDSEWVIQ